MKLIIDVNVVDGLKQNDVIIYNKKKNQWQTTHYDLFVAPLRKENIALKEEVEKLKEEIENFKKQVNEKFKEHHDVLLVLKGDE